MGRSCLGYWIGVYRHQAAAVGEHGLDLHHRDQVRHAFRTSRPW
jgi:hypothetical protein